MYNYSYYYKCIKMSLEVDNKLVKQTDAVDFDLLSYSIDLCQSVVYMHLPPSNLDQAWKVVSLRGKKKKARSCQIGLLYRQGCS